MNNQSSCIFCKIISQEIPATIITENDQVIVIKDRSPKSPIHYLIIPKVHRDDMSHFSKEDSGIAAALLLMAAQLGKEIKSYRLIMNNGTSVGQSVFHAHMHFLAGKTMDDF